MNSEKSTGSKENGTARNKFEDEFQSLPLEDKFKSLFRMEVKTLEETFSYVADASMKAFERAGEVFNDIGKKVEAEVKKATASDKTAASGAARKAAASSEKTSTKKKSGGARKQPPKRSSSN